MKKDLNYKKNNIDCGLKPAECESIFNEIIDNIDYGLVIIDVIKNGQDFVFKYYNKYGSEIDKVNAKKVVGKKVRNVFPMVDKMGLTKIWRRVYKTGKPEYLPMAQYKDKKLSSWRKNYVFKLSTGEIVSVYEDVTKDKLREIDLQKKVNELAKLNNLMIGRELKMIELKKKIKDLEK